MPSIVVTSASAVTTAPGSAAGYFTIADNSLFFYPGAHVWIAKSDDSLHRECIIVDLVGTTKVGLRFADDSGPRYGRDDLSAYDTGSSILLESQVTTSDNRVDRIVPGTNITVSPPDGHGEVTVTASGEAGPDVPTSRQIISGNGLVGGGDLSADRTLDVVANADGSIIANANDIQVGILATDAQHGLRGGGTQHSAATTTVAGFLSAADKLKIDYSVADWPVTSPRFYAVDPAGGNDANLGWSDASMTAAGAVALKTFEKLRSVLPKVGAGRLAIVAFKTGGVSTQVLKVDTTLDSLDNREWTGYQEIAFVGTTDFSDNTADRTKSGGAIAQNGPNGDNSWTVSSATNAGGSFSITVSAGALTADPGLTGKRVRFTGNITAALANCVGEISSNTSGVITGATVIFTTAGATAAVPAAGDTFFIEEAGVVFSNIFLDANVGGAVASGFASEGGITLKGIKSTGAATRIQGFGRINMSFVEWSGGTVNPSLRECGHIVTSPNALRVNNVLNVTGTGVRAPGLTLVTAFSLTLQGWSSFSTPASLFNVYNILGGEACRFFSGISFNKCGTTPLHTANVNGSGDYFGVPSSTTLKRTVIDGVTTGGSIGVAGVAISGSYMGLVNIDITNSAGNPCILVNGKYGGCKLLIDGVAGSTGNTDVGIDVTLARNSQVVCGIVNANTVTGTAGDIRLSGPAITTHTSLTTTNVIDNQNNELIGTGGKIINACMLVSNQSGGALAIGEVIRQNGTSGQVTSAIADTLANSTGVLGPMVTTPASAANGYIATAGTPWVQFSAAPTAGVLAYLSQTTSRNATTVVPSPSSTLQVLRLGYVETTSGTLGRVIWNPDLLQDHSTIADWAIDTVRFYAIDPVSGSDTNLGYSDVSMTAAGAVALKTYEEFLNRAPRIGAGRAIVLAIKNALTTGTNVFKKDGVTVDDLDTRPFAGYQELSIVGTTDFTDNAADRTKAGSQTVATGPNGDGTWTAAAGWTNTAGANNGSFTGTIAAGTLPADPANAGYRVRFTGNITASLLNAVGEIQVSTSTALTGSTVIVTTAGATSAAPASGDTFFIEGPGVIFNKLLINGSGPEAVNQININDFAVNVKGIKWTNAAGRVRGFGAQVQLAFCDGSAAALQALNNGIFSINTSPRIAGNFHFTNCGVRVASASISFAVNSSILGFVCVTGRATLSNISNLNGVAGCRFIKGVTVASVGFGPGFPNVNGANLFGKYNDSTTVGRTMIDGTSSDGFGNTSTMTVNNSFISIAKIDVTNAGANPAIKFINENRIYTSDVAGSSGNTDIGYDLTGAYRTQIYNNGGTADTVTGTAGDIRLAGPAVTTHTGLTTTNVSDNQDNKILGSAGLVVGNAKLISNQSGGALTVGQILRQNGTSGQGTSAQADTSADATGVYGPLVTPPASASNGYMVTTGTPWVQFDGAPTAGAIAYLSTGTAGDATTTAPAVAGTNQVLRLGYVVAVSGTMGQIAWQPELIPITAT